MCLSQSRQHAESQHWYKGSRYRVPPQINTVTNNLAILSNQFSLIVLLMSPVLVTAHLNRQCLEPVYISIERLDRGRNQVGWGLGGAEGARE